MPSIQRIAPAAERPLEGAHLELDLRSRIPERGSYVYAGFLSSLDGRIGLADRSGPPPAIANPNDWRLFNELMMQADVVLSSGRYVRDVAAGDAQDLLPAPGDERFADLFEWRRVRGLPTRPAVAVLTTTGVFDPDVAARLSETVVTVSGSSFDRDRTRALAERGVQVVVTGANRDGSAEGAARRLSDELPVRGAAVDADGLIGALRERDMRLVCSAAGPKVLATLAPRLDALFLTVATRLVGGRRFSTLFEGAELDGAGSFELASAHYDDTAPEGAAQLFLELTRRRGGGTPNDPPANDGQAGG